MVSMQRIGWGLYPTKNWPDRGPTGGIADEFRIQMMNVLHLNFKLANRSP